MSDLSRARHLFLHKRYADAEADLRSSLADTPGDVIALVLLRKPLSASSAMERPLNKAERRSPQIRRSRRHTAHSAKRSWRRIGTLRASRWSIWGFVVAPDDPLLWELRGLAYVHLKRYREALDDADQALRLNPARKMAGVVRSSALRGMGETDEAARATAALLASDPNLALGHLMRARDHLTRGAYPDARAAFREALRLDPNSSAARSGLASTLATDHRLYAALLRYNVWYARQSKVFHKFAGLLSLFVPLVVGQITILPAPIHAVLIGIAMLIAGAVWMGATWNTLLLLADPFGRDVLPPPRTPRVPRTRRLAPGRHGPRRGRRPHRTAATAPSPAALHLRAGVRGQEAPRPQRTAGPSLRAAPRPRRRRGLTVRLLDSMPLQERSNILQQHQQVKRIRR